MNIQIEIDKAFDRYKGIGSREVNKISQDLEIPKHRVVTLLQSRVMNGEAIYQNGHWEVKTSES